MPETPHRRAEAQLVAYGLTLPETDVVPGWAQTQTLRVRRRSFAVFGDKAPTAQEMSIILKLPISFDMIQDLPFVRPSRGWQLQHNWANVYFGPDDDIAAEMETLKGWLRQSYAAMAPKRLGRLVGAA